MQLVQDRGYSVAEAAQSLGIDGGTLRQWLKKFSAAASGNPSASEGGLRAEVRRLREENKRLLLEREISKKATVFFAKQQP